MQLHCSSSFLFDRSLGWRLATNFNTNCSFLADLKYWRMSTKMAVCLKIWTVEQAMALCLARGFEPRSALHHQYLKSQPSPVGFFLPTTACLRGFLRVLADCGERHFCHHPARFTLRFRILSPCRPAQCRPKSGRHARHPYINQ
jgi:hypothetical protein